MGVTVLRQAPFFGQRNTLRAAVLVNNRRPSVGTIEVTDGETSIGGGSVTSTGQLRLVLPPTLGAGRHDLLVVYRDAAGVQIASSTLAIDVAPASTMMALRGASSASPGAPVSFTAWVRNAPPARRASTGSVSFWNSDVLLGTAPLTFSSLTRAAAVLTTSLPAGGHTITATYDGDGNHTGSTSGRTIAIK